VNYAGKCRHPHGHNGRLEVELARARLDGRGMVMDFEDIKTRLQTWIDENLDHRMILKRGDPLAKALAAMGEPVYLLAGNPTAENIAREVYAVARKRGLPVRRVTLWETEKSRAVFTGGAA
jgi:6-pyruvoyltetrahydropterin/6-carboxytetrahydropterin synthase